MLTVKFTVYFHISARTRDIKRDDVFMYAKKSHYTARDREIEDELKFFSCSNHAILAVTQSLRVRIKEIMNENHTRNEKKIEFDEGT